ncbi:lipoprotein [Plantactinospora endophytica]|uniref:Lipoprotein n=1 Tax=Plantactinospora endophytica TaxID=673535 RepID=A0ABQ4DTB1_9ACTN|nr:lipoprotein [Plantactinospora endophytica]
MLTLTAALALAGCGSDAGDHASSGTAADAPAGAEQAQPGAAEAPAGGVGEADTSAKEPTTELGVNQRAIVYTGSVTVRVDDVDAAAARAVGIATGAGGFLGGDNRSSDESRSEATLQLRVPADRFATVVDEIARLGEQLRRDIKTDDVTEESLDLDARIATQKARVESGRRLLAQANSLSDLVMLEGELAKREADLASLEAKKRRLADLTALSTITAVILGPNAQVPEDEPAGGFLAGLEGGWTAFVASLRVLLTVLGALLPWAIGLGLPLFGVLWLVRRFRARRPLPALTAPAPAARVNLPVPTQAPAPPD